jgi:hypothetical protein
LEGTRRHEIGFSVTTAGWEERKTQRIVEEVVRCTSVGMPQRGLLEELLFDFYACYVDAVL